MTLKNVLCSTTIIVLTVAVTALVLRFIVFGQTKIADQSAIDQRTTVIVTETERAFILSEMRAMLVGTQRLLQASLNKDMPSVVETAQSLGMKTMGEVPQGLMGKLPLAFKQLGLSVHHAFDQIALDAKDLGDNQHTLFQLQEMLQSCVACHASYKLPTD